MVHPSRLSLAPRMAVCFVAAMAVPSLVLHCQGRTALGRRQTVRIDGREAGANEALVTLKAAADADARTAIGASVDADEDEHVGGRVRRIHSRRFSAAVLISYLRTLA